MEDLIPIDIYKDPLTKNESGFGYLGCILQFKDESKIQCHICGKMFGNLGCHTSQAHKIKSKEYRKKFSLCWNTKLVSNKTRNNLISAYLSHSKANRDEWRKKAYEAYLKSDFKKFSSTKGKKFEMSMEVKNKRGSCPDQILEEIKKYHQETGKVPSQNDFISKFPIGKRYTRLAERTFGSWGKAVEACGLEKRRIGKGEYKPEYDRETLKEIIINVSKSKGRVIRYSDLLMGELPHYTTYTRHFGTLEKARQESGVYDLF